ncbi:MAG: hypothetical protein AAFX95_28135 [Cyanobacteria bacterium J06639_16]
MLHSVPLLFRGFASAAYQKGCHTHPSDQRALRSPLRSAFDTGTLFVWLLGGTAAAAHPLVPPLGASPGQIQARCSTPCTYWWR